MTIEQLIYGLALGPLVVVAAYVAWNVLYENIKDIVLSIRKFFRGAK